jgi:uncharacterized membrane protein
MMDNRDKIIKSAITIFLAMTTTSIGFASTTGNVEQAREKCYGVAKAGMNDCATATSSCASSSTKDNQPDAFILLPKGLCQRIVGGTLEAEKKK